MSSTITVEVLEDGRYPDGMGRAREFKKGKVELSADMARRFAEANPDKIKVSGESSPQPVDDGAIFS